MKVFEKKVIVISNVITTTVMLLTLLLNIIYDINKYSFIKIFSFSLSFLLYLLLTCFATSFILLLFMISKEKRKKTKNASFR